MQYCIITFNWPCINRIVVPWVFTISWVAVYAAPKLAIGLQYEVLGFVFIDSGHPIVVKVGWDGGLVDQGDLFAPEVFKRLKSLNNLGMDGLTCNPHLVFFGVHAALFNDA
jgi:hypothetical protein